MKLVELFLEALGWLQIVAGATIAASLPAFLLYLKWSTDTGKIIAIILVSVGFISGVIMATVIWRRHGTIAWLSRISRIS